MSITGGQSGGSGPDIMVLNYAVPTPLWNMMNTASVDQGVIIPVLVKIWAWESGATYPNTGPPNSSGYGGLFGLGQGEFYFGIGPINVESANPDDLLNQCEAAAAEVHYLVSVNNGNLYQAMLAYDGGSVAEAQDVASAAGGGSGITGTQAPPVESVGTAGQSANVPSSVPAQSSAAWDQFRVGFNNIIPSIVGDITAIKNGWGAQGNGGVAGGPYR